MRSIITFIFCLFLLALTEAATNCRRDACYKNVVSNGPNRPNAVSRTADCRSVLKIVQGDRTVTVRQVTTVATISTTLTVKTTSTSTTTSYVYPVFTFTADLAARIKLTERPALEERDRIVAKGRTPAYATECGDLQAFATACLCAGVKAAVVKTVTQYITTVASTTQVILSATTVSTSTTTTEELPFPTECNQKQIAYCTDGSLSSCQCRISEDSSEFVCVGEVAEPSICDGQDCETNAGCRGVLGRDDAYCVLIEDRDNCSNGLRHVCVAQTDTCRYPQPFRRAKREIEEIFGIGQRLRALRRKVASVY